jgi:hypothetical protein
MTQRFKLGKNDPKFHEKTLSMSRILLPDALPPSPEKTYWEYKIPPNTIGMFANDNIGDCVVAAIAHFIMLVTAHTGKIVIPEVAEVVAMYSALSGYDPRTGANDNGVAITDALNYMQTVGLAGLKILGWAQLDHTNILRRHQGIHIFGANLVGVQLPAIAQEQFGKRLNWEDVLADGGIEGGHCTLESGYGSEGSNHETWGKGDQKASTAWNAKYMDEAYVVITQDWINEATGLAPNMLDMDRLRADLELVRA